MNRVSKVHTININREKATTYYSYDVHGNVEWVVQEIPMLGRSTLAYEYDLISGKVLKVKMNEGRADAFYHKYTYDEDNRLREAWTSTDGEIWERDARYAYFDHGPLKNIELGHDKVQNMQYAYTLNGWLKAINSPDLGELVTGEDNGFASDKFGMTLGYYEGDFARSTGTQLTKDDPLKLGAPVSGTTIRNLYNGNISSWVTSGVTPDGEEDKLTGFQYTYDKLNRIKAAGFNKFNAGTNAFAGTSQYGETYNYDLNGNILSLTRSGNNPSALEMDNLVYNYQQGTNKLSHIHDDDSYTDRYEMDIDNQEEGNYTYDEIGNLTADAQAGYSIKWNVYGKVAEVRPVQSADPSRQKPHIQYTYDASGNRIKKQVNLKPSYDTGSNLTYDITDPQAVTTTFYLRDASGNTMAVYERSNRQSGDHYEAVFTMAEVPIYGSDRLGIYTPPINEQLAIIPFNPDGFNDVSLDLGRVLAKLPGTETFIAVSQNEESAVLHQAIYNKTTNYYNITENWLNFIGSITGNVAVAENSNGEAQFYAVPAYTNRNVLMVYTNNKTLMPDSGDINFDGDKQVLVARQIGSTGEKYLLFTGGTDGRLYYHEVDMALNGGMGEVTKVNQDLDNVNTDYSGQMLAIEDHVTSNTVLLTARLNGSVLHLVKFEISADLTGSCKFFLKAYLYRIMRRTYSSPGLFSNTSVASSPMRTQFSSIPSGSMIYISMRRFDPVHLPPFIR